MSELLFLPLYVIGLVAASAALLTIGDLARKYLRFHWFALCFLAVVGALLSGIGWTKYENGQGTIQQAVIGTLLLSGLPLLVALSLVLHELPFLALDHLTRFVREKFGSRK